MSKRRVFFEKQLLHLAGALALILAAAWAAELPGVLGNGRAWGLSTTFWYWFALACAILHQLWVMLFWRAELHYGWVSARMGNPRGFHIYGRGFGIWSLLRFGSIIMIAFANRGSFAMPQSLRNVLALVCTLLAGWLMLSVLRYFGIDRALGADHFEERYRTMGLERRGIFRYVRNGMYTFGFLVIYIPGLLLASKAALWLGLLNHLYIWVHYYATEKPDMARIYQSAS